MKTENNPKTNCDYPKLINLEDAKKSRNYRVAQAALMIEDIKINYGRMDYSERYSRVHSQYERK